MVGSTKTMASLSEETCQPSIDTIHKINDSLEVTSSSFEKLQATALDETCQRETDSKAGTSELEHAVTALASLSTSPSQPALTTPSTLNEFTLFSSLPTELRLKIWRRALHLFPRTIRIGGPFNGNIPHFQIKDGRSLRDSVSVTATSAPTLLSVNREVRLELAPCYASPFVAANLDCYPDPNRREGVPRSVLHLRVNFDIDTLYITDGRPMSRRTAYPFALLFSALFGAGDGEEFVRRKVKLLAASASVWCDLALIEDEPLQYQHTQIQYQNTGIGIGIGTGTSTSTNTQLATPNKPYKMLHEFGALEQISVVTKKLQDRYTLTGFADVVATTAGDHPTAAETCKLMLEERLKTTPGSEGCVVKVVSLQQKYLRHRELLNAVLKAKAKAETQAQAQAAAGWKW